MTLDWAVSSAGLILIVGLLRFVLKDRLRAGVRYAVWGLVLLRLLLPVNLGQSVVSVLNAVESTPVARTAELVETVDRVEWDKDGTVEGYRTRPDGGAELIFTRPASNQEYKQIKRALDWWQLLPLVWLTGMGVVLAALGISSLRFYARLRRSRRRLAVRCRVPVYVSGAVEAPCLAGLLRPAIYLTETAAADPAVVRHVLAHELTHLHHRDNLWAVLRGVCLALHWFDPLAWWAAAASRQDGELACDEAALRRLAPEERAAYGRTLLAMSCARTPSLLVTASTLTGGKRSLRERVMRIAHRPRAAAWAVAALVLAAALAAGCTFTGAVESGTGTDGSSKPGEPADVPGDKFDEDAFLAFFTDSRLGCALASPIEYSGELAKGLDYTRLQQLARLYQDWQDGLRGETAPVNEQGNPYYPVDQMQELIWQLFGLWPDLISPAMDQQEMGLVPEGYLGISGEADCGDRIVEPVRDSLTCREGIIRLEAEVYNTDGSEDAPPDDTLAYFFAYLPENSLCPYRLLSVRKATETEPWPARGQTDAQEGDPPVSGEQLAYLAVPDFLNAEQRELYQRAAAVYPIFVGSADTVDSFPRADGSLYGKYALVREFNGKNYIRAWNRYEHWEDFTAMLSSVFTPGYRDELLAGERFLNQDGILYYLDNGVGSILGYMPDVLPDEFAVTEQTETMLTFDRIGHYLTEWDEEQQRWNPDAYETRRFSIRMEKVEGSWRIARFADPNWDQETASVRTFDPVYFAREFSRGTSQKVLQEQFPDLREEPDPPQPGDPENLVLISEGWEYEGVPGVVLFTCDAGQLRTAYFHGYGADFEKFRAVRDTLERQLEQAGLMEQLEFGTMKATEAIDMNDHAKWVPFSEEETTFPPNYVLPVVLNFSQPSLSLSLEYAGAEAAPLWYKSLYNSTGPLAAREQAGPATDFCIGFAY